MKSLRPSDDPAAIAGWEGQQSAPPARGAGGAVSGRRSVPVEAGFRRLSLTSNFSWTFAGSVVNAASQWGMLAVLARMATAEAVGQFVLGLAVAAPIVSLTMLQLRAVQVTDARGDYGFSDYLGTRLVWTLVGLAAISACALAGPFRAETAWVILLVGLMKSTDSVADIVRGLFQRYERMDYSGISMMLKGPPALVALTVVMGLTGRIVPAASAMCVVWIVSLAAYDVVCARKMLARVSLEWTTAEAGGQRSPQGFLPRFDVQVLLSLTWVALPLGIVMFLISLQTNIPRYVLQGFRGEAALGYFGALVYPMVAGMLVTGALGQSASPRLARDFLGDRAAYRALLGKLTLLSAAIGAVLVIGVWLLGREVLAVLYGAEYGAYNREFLVAAVAWAVQLVASSFGYGLTAARVFRAQVVIVVASCVVTALAALLLVPQWGVMGAAASVVATSISMCAGFVIAMRWTLKKSISAPVGLKG